MPDMGFLKASSARLQRGASAAALCTYQIGQRTVQLFELASGHIQWVCNCEDYAASAGLAQGAWCKHVAKASAIRSIERLTGARTVGRGRTLAAQASAPVTETRESPLADLPVEAVAAPH